MRKITTGQVGHTLLGDLVVSNTTLETIKSTDSLTLSADKVSVTSNLDINNGNYLNLKGDSGGEVRLIADDSFSSTLNFTLPTSDGTAGFVLRTDGNGNLSWVDVSFEVSNVVADTSTYYPIITTTTSGSITNVNTSSSKLSYTPSSGTLAANTFSGDFNGPLSGNVTGNVTGNLNGSVTSSNVTITGGTINDTTIGNNNRASAFFTSVSATSTSTFRDIDPESDGNYDLGSSNARWRNIFTNDLNLSNMSSDSGNDIDNTKGDWTIQEGKNDLYLINNLTQQQFKFKLEAVN